MSKKAADVGFMEKYLPTFAERFGRKKKRNPLQHKPTEHKKPFMLRFSTQEQVLFTKRLAMILRAGLPIMQGLHMLHDQSPSRSGEYIVGSLIADISNGQPLSSGLQKFDRIFGRFCINIVKVGETSGTLHQNLEYLSEEMKKKQTLKRKVIGALIYPAVIVAATVGIVLMLTVYIFPKIIPIFQSVKATLPITTRILIAISGFLTHWGLWLLLALVALAVGMYFLMRLPRVHLFFDQLLLRTPLFGSLSQYYNLANISRTMAVLLKSDVRIVQSIELVAASTRNLAYRQELLRAKERLIKGQKISDQFAQNLRLFPPIVSQMVTVGESTGNLSTSLMFLSDMYEEEISELTKNLTNLMEPVLMIIMGLTVGFIAISIITPIYSITSNLTPH